MRKIQPKIHSLQKTSLQLTTVQILPILLVQKLFLIIPNLKATVLTTFLPILILMMFFLPMIPEINIWIIFSAVP